MKITLKKNLFVLAILFVICPSLCFATTFEMRIIPGDIFSAVGIDFYDYTAASQKFTEYLNLFTQKNDEVIPTGLALANVLGYPNGRSKIGVFPHFTLGVGAGVSTYKLFRYKDYDTENPEIPGGGINGTLFFGTGLDDSMDFMFKIFALGSYYVYDRELEQSITTDTTIEREILINFTDNSIYSFGVKARYHVFQSSPRSFLSFGGLNFNLSFDYMSARFAARGEFKTTKQIDLIMPLASDEPFPAQILASVDGAAAVQWHFFTITPEIVAYFNVLYIINLYTGFGFSINRGIITFEVDATGTLTNTQDIRDPKFNTLVVPANSTIATAVLHCDSSMEPVLFLPRYLLGVELDVFLIKLAVEASVVLNDPSESFTAQIGVRTEF